MSSKTIYAMALAIAMIGTAAIAADPPAADAAASPAIPDNLTIHWQRSMSVPQASAAHTRLTRFLKQHASTTAAMPQGASLTGDFQVSFGHTMHGAPGRQADAYAPPFDPTAQDMYARGDTFVAVTCREGMFQSWHFVYQPAAHGNDRPQWENIGMNYKILSPKGHCPAASQWLPDEAKNSASQGSSETGGATPAS